MGPGSLEPCRTARKHVRGMCCRYICRIDFCPTTASPTLLEHEFSLADKVAIVTGANRGLGLEGALALAEAGARAVYCVDIADSPSSDWARVQQYVSRMRGKSGESRLEYIRGDVSDQVSAWRRNRPAVDDPHCLIGADLQGWEGDWRQRG